MSKRSRHASPILGTAAALIGEASSSLVTRETRFHHTFEAPVDCIDPHAGQARRRFDETEIAGLASTMAERGQLQPILLRKHPTVRERWVIVAGERRWRAARLNGWPTILAIEHEDNPEVASLIENLQRVDLTPVEEARGLEQLLTGKGWTQSAAAAALGKSKAEVSATLRILSLPPAVLEAVLTSELQIPKNALIELARIQNLTLRDRLIKLAREGALTIRAIREAEGKMESDQKEDAPSVQVKRSNRDHNPRTIDLRTIDRLTRGLHVARATGHTPNDTERERLASLRKEIDGILDGSHAIPLSGDNRPNMDRRTGRPGLSAAAG